MKKIAIILYLFIGIINAIFSQTFALDNSVLLTAAGSNFPDKVTLQWVPNASATQYKIYRKLPTATSWGAAMATLPATDSVYVDNTVTNGTVYEYKVERTAPTQAFGYVLSGVDTKINYNNGIMILLVDSFFIPSLNAEIAELKQDYEMDGWFVKQLNIGRTQTVVSVKSLITSTYSQDPTNTKALMLLGHIPVPYSGLLNPDGHPDHLGAWPADVFYADMDGIWTDITVNDNTSATDPRNHNTPGDGKYDQSELPSMVELTTGRVDFYDLPGFSLSETELMHQYLTKLHNFKIRGFIPNDLAVVEDNFGGYAEGFSSSGYKNFSSSVGPNNILTTDWLATLDTLNALWSYGCGGGWYQGAGGIATSTDFATDSVLSVFNMLFGSYFGDWDVQNSFLRSALGSGTVLTNVWAGRPHWQFHQMSLGYNIGYSTLKTQNNLSTYFTSNLAAGYFARWTHIALLGDPSLRMHYIAPPNLLVATEDPNHVIQLGWIGSTELVEGYNVYRKLATDINWTQLNNAIIIGTTYNDSTLSSGGDYQYMVRATRDQQTASGTYKNLSLGAVANINSNLLAETIQLKGIEIFPNPTNQTATVLLNYPFSSNTPVNIYNSLGECLMNTIFPANATQLNIDFNGFSDGIYYIQTGQFSVKLIKQ